MKMLPLLTAVIIAVSTFFAGTAQAITVNGFANGGFEESGFGTPANAWIPSAQGYSRSSDARTDEFSLQLMSPAVNSAVALQHSVIDGGQPPLTEGDNPSLSFWAKGFAGDTGKVLYALRYLNDSGGILADSGATEFQASINESAWTEITDDLGPVPVGAVAAFIEFSHLIGPVGFDPPSGGTFLGGTVLIDDVYLGVVSTVVPEPTSAILLGLGGLGFLARR